MKKTKENIPVKSDLILYQTEDGKTRIEVCLEVVTWQKSRELGKEVR